MTHFMKVAQKLVIAFLVGIALAASFSLYRGGGQDLAR